MFVTPVCEIPVYRSGQLICVRFKCSWFLNLGTKEDTKTILGTDSNLSTQVVIDQL